MISNELLERVKQASILDQAKIIDDALEYITVNVITREEMILFVDLLKHVDSEVFKETMYTIATQAQSVHERLINIEDYLDLVLDAIGQLPQGGC